MQIILFCTVCIIICVCVYVCAGVGEEHYTNEKEATIWFLRLGLTFSIIELSSSSDGLAFLYVDSIWHAYNDIFFQIINFL